MVKKPSLSIHIELYILSQTTNIEEISSLSFILEKLSSLILVSLGSKGKEFGFEKGKIFWAEGKKVCSYTHEKYYTLIAQPNFSIQRHSEKSCQYSGGNGTFGCERTMDTNKANI